MTFGKNTSPLPPDDRRCIAIKRNGERCANWRLPGLDFCWSPKHGPRRSRKIKATARHRVDQEWQTIVSALDADALPFEATQRRARLAAALDAVILRGWAQIDAERGASAEERGGGERHAAPPEMREAMKASKSAGRKYDGPLI